MPSSRTTLARRTSAPETAASKASRPFEIRRSKIQGRGAFATRPIRKGQRLIEYLGERITHEEADRRYDDSNGRHHTFLFILDDDTVLDARYGGNDARFLNHSCDPNCETVIEDGHIWIESIKAIQPETELVYDYRFEWDDDYDADDVRYYACRCGTAKCRGTILRVPAYLRPTVKKWLAGEDVKKPKKPVRAKQKGVKKSTRKSAKKASKKASKKSAR